MFLSLTFCHLIKSLQQCCHGNFSDDRWSDLFLVAWWHSYHWLVHCCFHGVLALYCPLPSACTFYTLCFALSYELDVVWLFFAFILVEWRNKWILAFWIIICPFSTQKCQCSASNLASVLENVDSGMFVILKIWIFNCIFCMAVICHYLELFNMYLDFLSGNITQDKYNSVYGFLKIVFSGCVAVSSRCLVALSQWQWLLFMRVHSHHCHWSATVITAFPCTPHIYTLSVLYSLFQVCMWSRLWSAKCYWLPLEGLCCRIQVLLVSAKNSSSCGWVLLTGIIEMF